MWQYDVQGDEDVVQPVQEVDLAVNKTLEEYINEANLVRSDFRYIFVSNAEC